MLQILSIVLIVMGIATVAAPAKISVDPKNKKQIAAGQEPMSAEEYELALQKARKSGILTIVAGVVMFVATSFLGALLMTF